ncbi:MAG: DUF1801 domain-containing protein [Bacteroidetes bacterium]|nr:MAG: DUF1801 domain-containing protein [Bacteroidota bacterium]REK07609.1 MAG: DUF1801 domain-containing protein [Bacteroidota bacterium]REK36959.1 MAG: DUF1801 domain-containing protein [Bacteroidota bacterium]REK47779.1 MAG: DUF1801 domain-containing protein [Bacteroidota bacterium]
MDSIESDRRRSDSKTLLKLFKEITGKTPKIWGNSIIAYGKYKYKRKNGDEFGWFNAGFSPGKSRLSVYVMYDINTETQLLKSLGPHKKGKGCLYINKLSDINLDVLKKLIKKSRKWLREKQS